MSSYIDDRIDAMTEEQVRTWAKRLYISVVKSDNEITETVAAVLGYEYDDEYGWVIGDHVAESLVAELVTKYRELVG